MAKRKAETPSHLRELALGLLAWRDRVADFAKIHLDERGRPLDFSARPWLEAIYLDPAQEIVVSKCVQVGISTLAMVRAFAAADLGFNVLYVLPTTHIRNSFVAARIDKVTRRVAAYRERIRESTTQTDNRGVKDFGAGTIYFVGSNSESEFFERPADVAIVDEHDRCNRDHLPMIDDRLSASAIKAKLLIGNPSDALPGLIAARWESSDSRVWEIPCQRCGKLVEPDWFHHVLVSEKDPVRLRDEKWKPGCGRDIALFCDCGAPLDRLSRGRWRATRPAEIVSGYRISQLVSPTMTIARLWAKWLDAIEDETERQVFIRQRLGRPHSIGSGGLTEDELRAAVHPFRVPLPSARGCTAGVDVGKFLDVRISCAPPENPFARQAVFIGRARSFDEVESLFRRYGVLRAVVDLYPETRAAEAFQRRMRGIVWLAEFTAKDDDVRGEELEPDRRIVRVPRTWLLDHAVEAIRGGLNWLPQGIETLCGGRYLPQMLAPRRVASKDRQGNDRWTWTKGEDHALLADAYDWLARRMLGTPAASSSIYGAGISRASARISW